ncbi:MAG: class I SAM-dependent methyltransferase, partial [Hyphomicrobiales bacterium]|nr:class I SAM-dependent methyltransferase [Hyphomicrobiales bacterium]
MSDLERWESRFSQDGYLFGTAPNAFLKAQAHHLRPGLDVLSVADGDGRNGVWLAEQGLNVHSVDFSPTAIKKAEALAMARDVAIRAERADLFTWAWPAAAYDVVVAIFFQFAPPAERKRMFESMKQALRAGGLLLLEGYGPKQLEYGTGGPKQLDYLYTRALLEEAFGNFS